MKQFILTISLVLLPLFVAFGLNEYFLRSIPNDYAYKNQWMKENAKSLQVLNLGSSHAYFGIAPEYFDYSAFNLAHVSQDLKYDHFLFNKYCNQLDSLKFLILPISYFTLFSKGLEYGIEKWRVKNYTIYYDCPYHRWEAKYRFESSSFTGLKSIRAALGKENNRSCGLLGCSLIKESQTSDYNAYIEGKAAAERHTNKKCTDDLIERNIAYLKDMIDWCLEHDVRVILLTTPTTDIYRQYINEAQWDRTKQECEQLAQHYPNVEYWNYFDCPLFDMEDFQDEDHLNSRGAIKFSRSLNEGMSN